MAETTIVTKAYYEANIKPKVGNLLFPNEFYDCSFCVNMNKVNKRFVNLPKGKKILAIIVTTNLHPNFKNISNKAMPFECPICVDSSMDEAFEIMGDFFTYYAIGDVYIVVNV